jgi:hypothetical protein
VAALAGLATWRLGRDVSEGDWSGPGLGVAAVLGGLVVAALRLRAVPTRSFLRIAGAASVVYLLQFLVLSPTAQLISGGGVPPLDDDVAARVTAQAGDDPPDVVLVVFDALPTNTLLDGRGRIDAELFPHFAALADTASWYRDSTTVSMFTRDAVPAILTGRYPDPDNRESDGPARDPDNLFTLLGGTYDLHVREQITQLCPPELCPRPRPAGLGKLLDDAVELYTGGDRDEAGGDEFALPSVLDDDRFTELGEWIDTQDFASPGPDLYAYHAPLPHDPWQFLPDGTLYDTARYPVGYHRTGWYGPGIGVGHQRHVLQAQAADHLLGELLDRLRDSGTFDDSLVVVTADHGHAFVPDTPWRWLNGDNYDELMWAPLLVKAPGQRQADVVDDNVMSIDIVPTIADELGVSIPWHVDGQPAGRARDRAPDVKYVDDDEDNYWRADGDDTLVEVERTDEAFARVMATDPVEGTGPDAVWQRTPHGALVGSEVGGLDVGADWGGDESVAVEGLDDLDDIDTGEPLPLEAIGRSDLEPGAYVAYALNGTVAAVAEVEEDERADDPLVLGLMPPDLFVDGANELTAYVVEGEPGAEELRPLPVVPSDD